ncbi:MAG: deoxyribonuclease IV [Candidatus Andersenbacteria bacterium]|nr:deoxyribonuclease IV [Candidatus Andersenbacteria bacterium]
MKFGAHVSIAGGLFNAPANAAERGCEVFQMFSSSPRGGKAPDITKEMETQFKDAMKEHKQDAVYVHAPYILNFASQKASTWNGSIRLLRQDLERGSQIGATYVMFHTGSAKDQDIDEALDRAIEGLAKTLDGYTGDCQLLIENSAGAGAVLAGEFEQIARMLDDKRLKKHKALAGVCFDTQHAFAAGYDTRTPRAFKETFDQFDKIIGLDRLKMFHCNDSKIALGENKDRHEVLGEGEMGKKPFELLIAEKRLQGKDMIVETPGDQALDVALLKKMRNKVS